MRFDIRIQTMCVFHDNIEMVLVSQEKGSDQSRNLKMDDLGLVIKLRIQTRI